VPGLRRRRCSASRRYQRGPLTVAQATPWLIDWGDLLAAAQRAVQCPASCNTLVIAVPIAPAPAVTTAVRPRAESCAVVMASYRKITGGIIVAEGNTLACQTWIEGTFVREFTQSPVGPLPPTGTRVVMDLINIFRFDDHGRLIEEFVRTDYRSLLRQLGAEGR